MRVFIAIPINKIACAEEQKKLDSLAEKYPGFRFPRQEHVHLTVKFIGEIADDKLGSCQEIVAACSGKFEPLRLKFNGWWTAPLRGPVRIVALEVLELPEKIKELVRYFEDSFAALGVAKETREFKAHLTLARVKSDFSHGALRHAVATLPPPCVEVLGDTVVLYRTSLEREGAIYSPLCEAQLLSPVE